MAALKISFAFALLIIASNYNPACGQNSQVDFFFNVADLLTQDIVSILANVDINKNATATTTTTQAPVVAGQQEIVVINGQAFLVPAGTKTATATPPPSSAQDQWTQLLAAINALNNQQTTTKQPSILDILGRPATTTTPNPCATKKPECSNCKPEKVRIVLVDDCDDKKSSSESCSQEDSEEIQVIAPRDRSGRRSKY